MAVAFHKPDGDDMSRELFGEKWLRIVVFALMIVVLCAPAFAQVWRFGVMSDTQWTTPDDGKNPNSVAVGIINQINDQFIKNRVQFVIQV
jgi:hypothetical protein